MAEKTEISEKLLTLGRKQGHITYDEFLSFIPDAESNLPLVEELMETLTAEGIDLVKEPPEQSNPLQPPPRSGELNVEMVTTNFFNNTNGSKATADEEGKETKILMLDFSEDEGYQHALNNDDVVGIYLKEAGKVPLLTAAEEVSLAQRIEAADFSREYLDLMGNHGRPVDPDVHYELNDIINDGEIAQEHLIRANSRLVISVAKRFVGRGVPFLDLIQEGNIGLIRAVRKFEYQRGHKFSTYATWWIRQAISRAVADQGRTIRVPVHMGDQLNKLRRITLELQQELGRDPLPEELAKKMETTVDKILNLIEISWRPVSLDSPIDDDSDSELGDFIEDTSSPAPDEMTTANLLREQVDEVLSRLPHREADILRMRYGLEDGETHTLEEVGKKIGVTRERVRQLEAQALNRLRRSSAHVLLRDYLRED